MAGLTPEEQAFFESGGDTAHLTPEPAAPAPPVDQIAQAGLNNTPPEPAAPAPPAPPAQPNIEVQPPPAVDLGVLQRSLVEAQQTAANLKAQLDQRTQAPPVVEPPAPDPDTDPLGALLHQVAQTNKTVAALQAQLNEQAAQGEQATAFQRFQSHVTSLRNEFAAKQADFPAAYQHIRDARIADLKTFGFDEQGINRTLFQEEVALSEAAIKAGKNPAAEIYEMAKRHGYVAKAAAAPEGAPAVPPATKLDGIKSGLQSAPPALPKTQVTETITAESLREASDADLNKLVNDPAAWSKIAGTDSHPL